MNEQQPPVEPEINFANIERHRHKLYDITCTPVTKSGPLPMQPITLLVIAENSSQATRKASTFFRELFPKENVVGIEVLQFMCRGDHLVVGVTSE